MTAMHHVLARRWLGGCFRHAHLRLQRKHVEGLDIWDGGGARAADGADNGARVGRDLGCDVGSP